MADKAIEILEKSREEVVARCQRELDEIDNAIARLRTTSDKRSDKPVPVKPGQFRKMTAANALLQYLNERSGGPVGMKQAARDLQLAGAEPDWQRDRYERNIKIMVANNRDTFRYNEQDDTVQVAKSTSKLA